MYKLTLRASLLYGETSLCLLLEPFHFCSGAHNLELCAETGSRLYFLYLCTESPTVADNFVYGRTLSVPISHAFVGHWKRSILENKMGSYTFTQD